ncbi:sensor domain-containing diguanylate cyclase [Vibrio sp. SCSIO 43136]|uniref:sensor domain-containing diguanylate cyclase n=1 Tax=Vibrio sp. SCSIO 43136 TaxID=2819101 RepID=UPI002075BADC|nr:sensor domain-containing diguanylate cyclase [Vibrio sp. SCSIO 43136]USD66975.1 sensor domain-containing diguanylate cyclase [Vibrio sp. SCSIO 43136]
MASNISKKWMFSFTIGALVSALLVTSIFYNRYVTQLQKHKEQQQIEQVTKLGDVSQKIKGEVKGMLASASLMLTNGQLHQFALSGTELDRKRLYDVWQLLMLNHPAIKNVAYLDQNGFELARMERIQQGSVGFDDDELRIHESLRSFEMMQGVGFGEIRRIRSKAIDGEHNPESILYGTAIQILSFPKGMLLFEVDTTQLMSPLLNVTDEVHKALLLSSDNRIFELLSVKGVTELHRVPKSHYSGVELLYQKAIKYGTGMVAEGNFIYYFVRSNVDELPDMADFFVVQQSRQAYAGYQSDLITQCVTIALSVWLIMLTLLVPLVNRITKAQQNLIESQFAKAAMDGVSALIITDEHNRIVRINDELTTLTGYSLQQLFKKSPLRTIFDYGGHETTLRIWGCLNQELVWSGEITGRDKKGNERHYLVRIKMVMGQRRKSKYYIYSLVDITARKSLERQLVDLSERDSLTSCYNRRKFDHAMEQEARLRQQSSHHNAVLALIDIDHFKMVNDRYGHDEGDRVIRRVAEQIKVNCRRDDLVARIGGEEFALILSDTTVEEAKIMCERIRLQIESNHNVPTSVSIGIGRITRSVKQTFKSVDKSLYEAKSQGRNRICLDGYSEVA